MRTVEILFFQPITSSREPTHLSLFFIYLFKNLLLDEMFV